MVGNHSGGNVTPDTFIFTLAFSTYFGVERRFHQLAHNLVVRLADQRRAPAPRRHRRRLARERARRRSRPARRCSSTRAATGRSTGPPGRAARSTSPGRKGFVRLALDQDVPIVPVVSVGGQETALFLSRGDRLARAPRPRQALPPQGAADLARDALGAERRRLPRPRPAAGEDHDRGAAADRPARAVRRPIPTSTRSTTTSPRVMQETLDALARRAALAR